jgi:hypothetical protein
MTLDEAMLRTECAINEMRDRAFEGFRVSLIEGGASQATCRAACDWYDRLLEDELTRQLAKVRHHLEKEFAEF